MLVDSATVRRALANHAIFPSFQPLVALGTGRLTGFEVLARWQHPHLGLILPENFISLAEEQGLISQLMEQILHKSFKSLPLLPDPLLLAINVSPTQLQDHHLPTQISHAALDSGFPLHRLTLEITESALLNDLSTSKKIARQLKDLGCRLALDDFGTGYSSLAHLQALPFDELKIDRSFVSSMTTSRESRKIVAATVGLGHSLGLITVAEGIETEEQADMLLWLGCEQGQGWLYGKASTEDKLPAIVAAPPRTSSVAFSSPGEGWASSSLEALPAQRLAQLQAIYDGAPVGLCFLDRNMRYVSLNRRLADMNGASIAAHIGKTVQAMIPPLFPIFEPYIRRALGGESISDLEVARPSVIAGQAATTILLSYEPAWDEADEVIGVSVAVVDISEQKRTADALRESDNHRRQMDELNPQVPWIMDREGNNLEVSSRWVQLTGFSREQTRNLGWLEALHPDDVEPTMRKMREGLLSGQPIDVEYRIKTIGGDWRWMRSHGSPRFSPTGEIIRWYGAVEDIDQLKRTQDALRHTQAQLHAVFEALPEAIGIAEASGNTPSEDSMQSNLNFQTPH